VVQDSAEPGGAGTDTVRPAHLLPVGFLVLVGVDGTGGGELHALADELGRQREAGAFGASYGRPWRVSFGIGPVGTKVPYFPDVCGTPVSLRCRPSSGRSFSF
jgi:hypothetical protein